MRILAAFLHLLVPTAMLAQSRSLRREWPKTDFDTRSVALEEIVSGGPPRDGIPAIDRPRFVPVDEAGLPDREGVISARPGGRARACPVRILIWHEIVTDEVGGVPAAVTWCPLRKTGIPFERRLDDGRMLDFGTTGRLRRSELVVYDHQTESWWQQFTGEAIVGELAGTRLRMLPARLESFARFRARHPDGEVPIPPRARSAPTATIPVWATIARQSPSSATDRYHASCRRSRAWCRSEAKPGASIRCASGGASARADS